MSWIKVHIFSAFLGNNNDGWGHSNVGYTGDAGHGHDGYISRWVQSYLSLYKSGY